MGFYSTTSLNGTGTACSWPQRSVPGRVQKLCGCDPWGHNLVMITTVLGSIGLHDLGALFQHNNPIIYIHRTSERLKMWLFNSPGSQVLIYLCSLLRADASGEAEVGEAQDKCQRALVPRCPVWQLPRSKDVPDTMSLSLYSQAEEVIGVFVLRGVLGPHSLFSPKGQWLRQTLRVFL